MSEQGVVDSVIPASGSAVVEPVVPPSGQGFGEGAFGAVTEAPVAPKPSPANDLRIIQTLLLEGTFAGKYAGMVLASFKLLDHMATQVEKAVNEQK